jgi:hypothetical protein
MRKTKVEGCACGQCNPRDGMRKCPLDENELSQLALMRTWSDKRLAAAVPAWARLKPPPKPFVFVPNAPPRYVVNPPARVTKARHCLKTCIGGPMDGYTLDRDGETGLASLTFTLAGQTGFYESSGKWVAQS